METIWELLTPGYRLDSVFALEQIHAAGLHCPEGGDMEATEQVTQLLIDLRCELACGRVMREVTAVA